MESPRLVTVALLLACMVTVAVVRMLPRSLAGVATPAAERVRAEIAKDQSTNDPAAIDRWIAEHQAEYADKLRAQEAVLKALLTFTADDGRDHVYLPDYDSYLWLRLARNELSTGNVCDEVVDGVCRDTFTHAPVGRDMIYDRSLHIDAIVALHRLITTFSPNFPLSSTSYFVPVIVGTLGVIPAFFLGKRFGGLPGAVTAALVGGINPAFITRSFGSDNDVWNIVVPLFAAWAIVEALHANDLRRSALCSVAAAAVVAFHSAIWSGWMMSHVIVAAGIGATLGYAILRRLVHQRDVRLWRDARIRAVATVAVIYFSMAAVSTRIAASDPNFVQWHLDTMWSELGLEQQDSEFQPERRLWPSEFVSVAEVRRFQGGDVTLFTTNVPLLLLSFFGAALLALGPLPWTIRQWLPATIALLMIGYAYGNAMPDHSVSRVVLFAPIALAMLAALLSDREHDKLERGAFVVVAYLGVAYSLGTVASRFVMMFAAPVGLGAAVLAGWIYRNLTELLAARVGRQVAVGAGVAAVAGLLAYPLYRGYVTARDLLPQMDDAWWQAFTDIREASPPDAIVNVWWDDGHWGKYISERRVIADGASLKSHILFWFTRALLAADEPRSAGTLRMLACGSDATPYVEGKEGAYGKLRATGMSVINAQALVDQIVIVDRAAAEQLLAARGISSTVAADILASSHCTPPPMYVVVSDDLAATAGWGAGLWDFRRAYVVERARYLPREEALRELTQEVGYSAMEARQLYREAAELDGKEAIQEFVAPELGYLTKTWIACTPDANGANVCPLSTKVTGGKQTLDAFQYSQQSPAAGRLRIRTQAPGGAPSYSYRTPGQIVIAGESSFFTAKVASATDPGLAVLVDVPGRRILMAEAAMLTSTFTKLMFLDGRYLTHFKKVGEYRSVKNKIVTYLVQL